MRMIKRYSNFFPSVFKGSYIFNIENNMIRERSLNKETLSGLGNTGSLASNLMFVNSAEDTKVFKVIIKEGTSSYLGAREFLITLSYIRDHSVNDGITIVSTSTVDSGYLGRVVPTLSATAGSTDKAITFDWSAYIDTEVFIERVL